MSLGKDAFVFILFPCRSFGTKGPKESILCRIKRNILLIMQWNILHFLVSFRLQDPDTYSPYSSLQNVQLSIIQKRAHPPFSWEFKYCYKKNALFSLPYINCVHVSAIVSSSQWIWRQCHLKMFRALYVRIQLFKITMVIYSWNFFLLGIMKSEKKNVITSVEKN